MTFSRKILVGLLSGLALGLFAGELVAPLKVVADGFVKLLQMTVLPYVTLSIITSLGALDATQAKRLGLRVGAVLIGLWVVALAFASLFPLAFPSRESAAFFSTTLIERRPPFNFVDLYIPSNPFHSLANGVVPAVVLFAVVLGIAMIGIEKKQVLLDVLSVATSLVSRATRFVVQLTPYGMFAIAATAAGTLNLQQIGNLQVYLLTYVAISLLVALWVLPGLVSALTPIGYRELMSDTRDALITAFMAGDLFIVLPSLNDACKALLARHEVTDEHSQGLPDVIVPASFNFPHTGKLLSVSFILFAGWFADAAVRLGEYPKLLLTGVLTFFGSLNAAVPFLLDMFRIPADTFQLYLATGVINARFGALLAALHTVAVGLLGSAAVTGKLRLQPARFVRFVIITVVLTVGTIGGLRLLFSTALRQEFKGADVVYGMRPVFGPVDAREVTNDGAVDAPTPSGAVMDEVRQRGALRVCVLPNRMPYVFRNREKALVGFDVEMAHRLAHDLEVRLEVLQLDTAEQLPEALGLGRCDLAMAGVPVTPRRAAAMLFTAPYLDETLAFIVRDNLRDDFASWARIRELEGMRVGAPNIPYYLSELRDRAPALVFDVVDSLGDVDDILKHDAFLMSAERASVLTLLHPEFAVAIPEPGVIKIPLAYPVARFDERWVAFLNTWIELKRRDGSIDRLYRHWILGQDAVVVEPRWSVVRNVLHWVD